MGDDLRFSTRSGRTRVVVAVALLVLIATGWRLWLLRGVAPALFWDSASYLEYAASWLNDPSYFLRPHFRPFGYPLLILLASGFDLARLEPVVLAQHVLGVAAQVLLFAAVLTTSRSVVLAFAAGLASCLFVDLLFMEVVIYSETLALAVTTLIALVLVIVILRPHEDLLLVGLLGAVTSFAVFVRPVMLFALPPVAAVLAVAAFLRLRTWRAAAVYCLVCISLVGGYGVTQRNGRWRFEVVSSSGCNLLTWVGFPSIYLHLPPEMDHIRRVYIERAEELGKSMSEGSYMSSDPLRWGEMLKPVIAAERAAGVDDPGWGRAAARVTVQAVQALPLEFLRLWRGVVSAYLGEYFVRYGLWRTESTPIRVDTAQVSPSRLRVVGRIEKFWKGVIGWMTTMGLVLPIVLLAVSRVPLRARLALLGVATLAASVLLANTLLEPTQGQARYRMPVELVYLMLAMVSVHLLGSAMASRLRTQHGRPASSDP